MYEQVCELLRTQFDANELPIDVYKIARGMGIAVVTKRWRGRPHAACVPNLRMIILNGRRPETARRFDLAHELGHFVLEGTRSREQGTNRVGHPSAMFRTGMETHAAAIHGDRAQNRFAAALLLPRRRFEAEWIQSRFRARGDTCLGETFRVSMWVVMLRYKELRQWHG